MLPCFHVYFISKNKIITVCIKSMYFFTKSIAAESEIKKKEWKIIRTKNSSDDYVI